MSLCPLSLLPLSGIREVNIMDLRKEIPKENPELRRRKSDVDILSAYPKNEKCGIISIADYQRMKDKQWQITI